MRRTRTGLFSALLVVFALVGGGMAEADHWWGGYKWATTDGVVDLYADVSDVQGGWTQVTQSVLDDWNESQRIGLDTSPLGKQGVVTVESGSFGRSGWLGVALVKLDSRQRIVGGRVRLNEWYWRSGVVEGLNARQHVLCQELGHIFGLDHQLGQSCMNDRTRLGAWVGPNAHDYDQLDLIYSRLDDYDSGTVGGSPGKASRARAAQNWVVVHAYPAPGKRLHK